MLALRRAPRARSLSAVFAELGNGNGKGLQAMSALVRRPVGLWVIAALYAWGLAVTIWAYQRLFVADAGDTVVRALRERFGPVDHVVQVLISALSLFALVRLFQFRKVAVRLYGVLFLFNLAFVAPELFTAERSLGALVGPLMQLWIFVYVLRLQKTGVLT